MLWNFLANLAKAARAKSRGAGTSTISLDDPNLERDGEAIAAAADNGGSKELGWCEYIHLRQDLHRPALIAAAPPGLLPPADRELGHRSRPELGLARGSIYSQMATLKRAFAAAGLDVYLARPRPTLPASAR